MTQIDQIRNSIYDYIQELVQSNYETVKIVSLECTQNGSNKFYDIWLALQNNCSFYEIFSLYGRIGADGAHHTIAEKEKEQSFQLVGAAIRKIEDKLKKGYEIKFIQELKKLKIKRKPTRFESIRKAIQ